MLSYRTQNRLASYIKVIAESEKKLEVVRQVLAEQKLFEPQTTFKRLDQNRDEFISTTELIDFLEQNKVKFNTKEVLFIFKFLDYDDDGVITQQDFVEQILPKEDPKLRTLITLRDSYYLPRNQPLVHEVEWGLCKFFEQLIKNFRQIESSREILESSFDYSVIQSFNAIDIDRYGFIDFKSMDEFMRSCNQTLTDEEILAFIRVVGDEELGKITYSQFQQIFFPNNGFKGENSPQRVSRFSQRQIFNTTPKRNYSGTKNADYYEYLSQSQEKKRIQEESQLLYTSPLRQRNSSAHKKSPYSKPIIEDFSFRKHQEVIEEPKLSPMKVSEELKLVQALKQIVQIDRDIEEEKKKLAFKSDFNLMDAFRLFDRKELGYCNNIDLELALNKMGIYPTNQQLVLLFKKFSKSSDQMITFSKFSEIILPQSSEYANIMNNRLPKYVEDSEGLEIFDIDTRLVFKKLINLIINGECEAEELRIELSRRPMFSLQDAFEAIDRDENGFITIDEFKEILNDYGFFVNQIDLQNLVDRFDQDKDGKVSYGEFIQEMSPKTPSKLLMY